MSHGGEKAIKAALLANTAIAAMKLAGAVLSGSASMLAEFKHSVADASNGLFLLAGVRQSRKAPDVRFQFGYGKTAFFWSFVAALAMLSIGGAFSIYGGVNKILNPEHLEHVAINLGIIAASILFEIYSLYSALKGICLDSGHTVAGFKVFPVAMQELGDASPTTRFIFFEDTAALLGLIIAGLALTVANYTGNTVYDGIASIIIGLMLLTIGFYTARENMASITGEAADPDLVCQVGDFAKTLPHVKDIHRIKTMRVGAEAYLLNLIIEGDKNLTLAQVDDINLDVKMEIERQFPEIRYTHVTMIEEDAIDDWSAYCDNVRTESDQRNKG
jgi:cation diffusion facilitator family transporter